MAITGTGTVDDPYLVHSYEELKTQISGVPISASDVNVKLGNDIDCNDYGDIWEWETITLSNYAWNIDLDGHTIKNIMIKSGNSLFSGANKNNIIHNGKILNVFNNKATNLFVKIGIKNLAMSANGTGLTNTAFSFPDGMTMENCSLYFKTAKLNAPIFYNEYTGGTTIKNCDLWFDISDLDSKTPIDTYYGLTVDNCRIRGKVKGVPPTYSINGIQTNYLIFKPRRNTVNSNNNVIELDTSELNISDTDKLIGIFFELSNTNSVINKEIMHSTYTDTENYNCTTAQMRDPDYLNSIGFNVVKVGG